MTQPHWTAYLTTALNAAQLGVSIYDHNLSHPENTGLCYIRNCLHSLMLNMIGTLKTNLIIFIYFDYNLKVLLKNGFNLRCKEWLFQSNPLLLFLLYNNCTCRISKSMLYIAELMMLMIS